jgi:hypothetical protein
METPTASVVFEHNFDQAMLEQIDTLRTIRLNLAEGMLQDVERTSSELLERGLFEASADEVRRELMDRVKVLRERLQHPEVIYADELDLYVDLVDTNLDGELEGSAGPED